MEYVLAPYEISIRSTLYGVVRYLVDNETKKTDRSI